MHFHEEWDAQLRDAFKEFNKVAQPFLQFVDPKYKEKALEIGMGKAEMDSILNCYYSGTAKAFSF